jgi:hypothetical protein
MDYLTYQHSGNARLGVVTAVSEHPDRFGCTVSVIWDDNAAGEPEPFDSDVLARITGDRVG